MNGLNLRLRKNEDLERQSPSFFAVQMGSGVIHISGWVGSLDPDEKFSTAEQALSRARKMLSGDEEKFTIYHVRPASILASGNFVARKEAYSVIHIDEPERHDL